MNHEQTKQLIQLIDEYCQSYGLTRQDLFISSGGKKKRKIGLVSLSTMRMALGHYIYQNYPLSLVQIAQLIGYSDHSVMSYHYRKIHSYIKMEDKMFMGYYRLLLLIASKYPTPIKIKRVPHRNYVILSK